MSPEKVRCHLVWIIKKWQFWRDHCFDFDFERTEMIYLKGQGWARIGMIKAWLLSNERCDTRPWYNNKILLIGSSIKEKGGGALTLSPRCTKQGQGFYWLTNQMWTLGDFFLLSRMIEIPGHWSRVFIDRPIGTMLSDVWSPIKEDSERVRSRSNVGSIARRPNPCRWIRHPKSWFDHSTRIFFKAIEREDWLEVNKL